MPVPITRESFTEAMRKAVADRGRDFVYPDEWKERNLVGQAGCMYFGPDGEPRCIIGTALHNLGYGPQHVTEHAAVYSQRVVITDDDALLDAAYWAQEAQDQGLTWGAALEGYERRLNKYRG